MPNISIFISESAMPAKEQLDVLTRECIELCLQILQAKREKIHIIFIAVTPGHGLPVSIEIKYRQQPYRTAQVMDQFLAELHQSVEQHIALPARIRCFGYDAGHIHALN
ncbi:hypothetical protein [Celerinatantimonas sp. YJH-8]|uniref:hypothetical protein n=1 Tax=Celerinatantimonas sp. YJH-8 TaxID=3228714 RepID=UPI0038C2D49B